MIWWMIWLPPFMIEKRKIKMFHQGSLGLGSIMRSLCRGLVGTYPLPKFKTIISMVRLKLFLHVSYQFFKVETFILHVCICMYTYRLKTLLQCWVRHSCEKQGSEDFWALEAHLLAILCFKKRSMKKNVLIIVMIMFSLSCSKLSASRRGEYDVLLMN